MIPKDYDTFMFLHFDLGKIPEIKNLKLKLDEDSKF